MKNEAFYKAKLVREVNHLPGAYARRCEDKYRPGVLDLILKFPALPVVFAEGKLVRGNLFAPTPLQWREGKAIEAAGMIALLLGWKGDDMYVSIWTKEADIRTCWAAGAGNYASALCHCLQRE